MNKLFAFRVLTVSCFLTIISILAFGFFFNRPLFGDFFGLRDNGSVWYQFGPGLISECKCESIKMIYITRSPSKAYFYVTNDKKKIAIIKDWILQNNFVHRWNLSPFAPDYSEDNVGAKSMPCIILYGDDTASESIEKIVTLPLTPLAMGLSQTTCDAKTEEIKKLILQ